MTSRMHRLLHRPRRDGSSERHSSDSEPELYSTQYETMHTGGKPHRGTYPIRGGADVVHDPNSHRQDPEQHQPIAAAPKRKPVGRGNAPNFSTLNRALREDEEAAPSSPVMKAYSGADSSPSLRRVNTEDSGEPTAPRMQSRTPRQSHQPQTIIDHSKRNSETVYVDRTIAPEVTHEVVHQHIHHAREEHITREVHSHEYYHRILPVDDVEVLPTRHFVPSENGGLVEISSEDVPGRGKNWAVVDTSSQDPAHINATSGPRKFSARAFEGKDGDSKRYITPEGYTKTEQTWVHSPELATASRDAGETVAIDFNSLSLDESRGRA